MYIDFHFLLVGFYRQIMLLLNATVPLFLIFTQFYSGANCHYNTSNINVNDSNACQIVNQNELNFTIHGLWPEFNNGSYPQYCNNTHKHSFNVSKLNPIRKELDTWWISYLGPNVKFWEHEYQKHETCFPNITELPYFTDALNLYKNTNMKHLESSFKMYRDYSKQQMNIYFNGVFQCQDKHSNDTILGKHKSKRIVQFWRCYNLELHPILCPTFLDRSCEDIIQFQY